MPTLSIANVRLAGLAAAIPPVRAITWADLNLPDDALTHEKRRRETPFRRMAREDQCQSDFCVEAARRLLSELDWQPDDIDVVVMTTLTPDYPIPATAIIIQDRLGIPKTAAAFDLPGGSDGFLHGLQLAAAMLASGRLRRALLLSGEVSKSEGPTWSNPRYQIVAGHAGTACALEFQDGAPAMVFDSGGDGSRHEAFYMPVGGVRRPPRPDMFDTPEGIREASEFIIDFSAIADVARRELPAAVSRCLSEAGLDMNQVDRGFFTPQELPVEEDIRRSIGLSLDRFSGRLPDFGICGSGSIPLGMLIRATTALRKDSMRLLLGDVGPGLSWGVGLLKTDGIVCSEILEM